MADPNVSETLLSFTTAMIADARDSLGLPESHLDDGIRPLEPFVKMAGTAVTVRLEVAESKETADLIPLVNAYQSQPASQKSIMVIEVPEELHRYGIFGDGAATMARKGGFVGAVIEGAIRDTLELRDLGFPVFSRTIAPGFIMGKATAAAVGEPVTAGGRTVHDGDLILGDNDGVVAIRPHESESLLAKAAAVRQWEINGQALLAAGKTFQEVEATLGPSP